MSTTITRYTGAGAVGAPARTTGTSASTATVDWCEPVLTWADLQDAPGLPDTTDPALIEGVVRLPGARRTPGGLSQVRVGWMAWADRVLVAVVARPLAPCGDGRFTPAGQWQARDVTTHTATGPASMRRGTVDPGETVDSTDPTTSRTTTVPSDHSTGAGVEPYLPAPVRTSVRAAVPDPVVWVGQLTRCDLAAGRAEQQLTTLRVGPTSAVVVKATRSGVEHRLVGQAWDVLQVIVPLAPAAPLIGRR